MKNSIIKTNKEDAYLLSQEHSDKVAEWLKTSQPENRLETFIEMFPNDGDVIEYEENSSVQNLNRLKHHIAVIESRLPLTLYFDLNGLTNDYLTKRLVKLVDNSDPEIQLRAINTVLKYKFPEEKAVRINPTQKNIYHIETSDDDRKQIIQDILKKLGSNDTIDISPDQ